MPIQTRTWNGGETGPSLPALSDDGLLTTAYQNQIANAIGKLEFGDVFGSPGGIPGKQEIMGWRLDRQNAPGGMVNISVQKNGVGSPSTVATVFVPAAYNIGSKPSVKDDVFQARIKETARAIRRGLQESADSYHKPADAKTKRERVITRMEVHGIFSSGAH